MGGAECEPRYPESTRDLIKSPGRPTLDYVILGEGNTSARADAESFWVKASGYELRTITADGFVRVATDPGIALLDAYRPERSSRDKDGLAAAKIDPDVSARPSVETLLHALCLSLAGCSSSRILIPPR